MNLSRLVYYSERNPSVSLDMRSLMKACHRNNAASNLTGILHYNGRQFLQVLEGGRAEVSAIYHRIAADPRHFNIILMGCYDARERLFPNWAMGLHEADNDKSRDIFLRYFSSNEVNPETVNVHSLLDVLQDFSAESQ
ncbi:MAG: BLUF domain-containing protein [Pseudomonadota bacterium]